MTVEQLNQINNKLEEKINDLSNTFEQRLTEIERRLDAAHGTLHDLCESNHAKYDDCAKCVGKK